MKTSFHSLITSVVIAVAIGSSASHAQDYPSRPVTIVVPFSAGGAVDAVARLMAQKLSDRLGRPVVVDNKPGASGNIGAQGVARAAADGYTLLMAAVTNYAINAPLQPAQVTYSLEKDLTPVGIVGNVPLMMVVNPSVPATTLQQLIQLAKAKPGQLTFASSGNGSTEHLAGELFKKLAGVDMLHVPYKGGAPAVADVMGGQVTAMVATTPNVLPNVKSNRLRALAIAMPARNSQLPDVPTAAEAGLPGFEVASMYGILAPAGTPQPIINKLATELQAVLQMPDTLERLQQIGVEASYAPPAEAARRIRSDFAKWGKVIQDANIKVD
ncbi:MAG TPA: tripartite tricarboxylate transporter substrate binding protein [Casimicrobiaceae bacterium]|nr:tripartite tricarboxylate transporter substrate binding protein [Casimicrobiaceae bacterium]